jgi:plasmid stability protein
MRQLLLRVPDDLRRRLAARADREGRSVNSLATEILDSATDADLGDRRSRLRSRAAAVGLLGDGPAPAGRIDPAARRRVIESTRGLGPMGDVLIDRERRDR